MYILVVGCGRIGYHLAKDLAAVGHEILVIERNPRRAALVAEEIGSMTLIGDGSEVGVLREAGAERADLMVATTAIDADNLVICQVAKHVFNVQRTVALVNNPSNQTLFKQLGVDVPVSSTEIIMKNIEEEIPTHSLVHILNLESSHMEVVVIRVPADGTVLGRLIRDVQLPPTSHATLVIRHGGTVHTPDDDFLLEAEDEVVCVTTQAEEEALLRTLTQVH
ncbi:MAG: trk system potassium uptake protein TrkA [Chloroflexi bacterium]|nr:MAG: trk system potassium uptake protein TrkA [Chloroflexota bacterium]